MMKKFLLMVVGVLAIGIGSTFAVDINLESSLSLDENAGVI